jgi:hypothetical protein
MVTEDADDADLAELIRARIRSGALASASAAEVDVAFAYVGGELLDEAVEVICEGCGLRGQLPADEVPPEGSMVFCIDCMGRLG